MTHVCITKSVKLINDLSEASRIYKYNMHNIKYENTF